MPYMLTVERLTLMKTCIPFLEIPKTFQDAMIIARYLGFRYIWIDSLCIIQNSRGDWEREAGRMCQIFKYSACTIAATRSTNSEGGCFSERNPHLVQPFKVCVNHFDGPKVYDCVDETFWENDIQNGPLNSRAWVPQEMLLSPRILHFGENQIYWQCQELQACEALPTGVPTATSVPLGMIDFRGIEKRFSSQTNLCSKMGVWNAVVEMYSQRSLTKTEDKLVALSGIASEMQSTLSDGRYLAGLWQTDLLFQLLWHTWDTMPPRPAISHATPAKSYRAPSWSWASFDGRVRTYTLLGIKCGRTVCPTFVDVLEARTTNAYTDTTGQVTDGYIRLRGKLGKVCLRWMPSSRTSEMYAYTVIGLKKMDGQIFPDDIQGYLQEKWVGELYCLPVLHWDYCGTNDFPLSGLLLRGAGRLGDFVRFGYFSVSDDVDSLKLAYDYFHESSESQDLRLIGSLQRDGDYVITLI